MTKRPGISSGDLGARLSVERSEREAAARRLLDLCKRRDDAPSWSDIEIVASAIIPKGET